MVSESIQRYKEQRDKLKQYFENAKTGDQNSFVVQEKFFKPLLDSHQESSKDILEKLATNQDAHTNALQAVHQALVPFNTLREIYPPMAIEDDETALYSTPQKDENIMQINLDRDLLNETHRENLQDMKLGLPSEVFTNGTIKEALEAVETYNRQIGQYLRQDSKKTDKEKDIYKSRRETLKIYKESVLRIKGAEKFIEGKGLVKQKRGRGRPRKNPRNYVYQDGNDLCIKLSELINARSAGKTGLDSTIKAILDELLAMKYIDQDDYTKLVINNL